MSDAILLEDELVYTGRQKKRLYGGLHLIICGQLFYVPEMVLGERQELQKSGVMERALKPRVQWKDPQAPEGQRELDLDAQVDVIEAWAEITYIVLKRNYPDMARDFVRWHISPSKLLECTNYAVAGAVKPEATAGEAEAVPMRGDTSPLNGTASMVS